MKKIKEIIEKKAMAAIKAALVELIEISKEQINEYMAEVRATSRWKRAAYGSDYYDVMNDGVDGEVEEISAEKWEQSWGGMVDGREREDGESFETIGIAQKRTTAQGAAQRIARSRWTRRRPRRRRSRRSARGSSSRRRGLRSWKECRR